MLSKRKKTEKENETFHNIDDANICTEFTFISSKQKLCIYEKENNNNNSNNDDRKKKMLMTTNIYNRKNVLFVLFNLVLMVD